MVYLVCLTSFQLLYKIPNEIYVRKVYVGRGIYMSWWVRHKSGFRRQDIMNRKMAGDTASGFLKEWKMGLAYKVSMPAPVTHFSWQVSSHKRSHILAKQCHQLGTEYSLVPGVLWNISTLNRNVF